MEQPQISNRILAGTEIIGDIKSSGDLRVDGRVKGNVQLAGKLVIGDKGHVEGEAQCVEATIGGVFKGKIQVKNLLTFQQTAKVHGDVITGKLAVESGAEFVGQCAMTSVVRDLNDPLSTKTEAPAVDKRAV